MHPPSRSLFARELYMNLLLDLLDPTACPAIHSSTLHTLVATLLSTPLNTRAFEQLDGLLTVTSLFKSRTASREVKMKCVEFLYFYLMPERPDDMSIHGGGNGRGRGNSGGKGGREWEGTKGTEEKQRLLGKYLGNVGDLVEDLRESAVFGGVGR
jgi:hypothetical protein